MLIHQKMLESRPFFVDKLIDMGAQDHFFAIRTGRLRSGWAIVSKLRGSNMVSPDIRAGIALLIAAMSAEGTSHIHNIDQIDRGYQNIDKRLNGTGARITQTLNILVMIKKEDVFRDRTVCQTSRHKGGDRAGYKQRCF
ncbi:MAG: hypothetical protein ACLR6J_16525 [Parabacteroides merdae]